MKKKEAIEVVQEVIESGDRVKLYSDLTILTTSANDKQVGTRISKDSIATIDINPLIEGYHVITLTYDDRKIDLYFQGLESISRVVRLAK